MVKPEKSEQPKQQKESERIERHNTQKEKAKSAKVSIGTMARAEQGNATDLRKKGREAMSAAGQKAAPHKPAEKGLLVTDKGLKIEPHNTRKEIAKKANVSTGQVAMAEQIQKKSPALWEQAKAGEVTINAAYT